MSAIAAAAAQLESDVGPTCAAIHLLRRAVAADATSEAVPAALATLAEQAPRFRDEAACVALKTVDRLAARGVVVGDTMEDASVIHAATSSAIAPRARETADRTPRPPAALWRGLGQSDSPWQHHWQRAKQCFQSLFNSPFRRVGTRN